MRLTPLGPTPRRETPCAVGCDAMLLVRRNRLNVGICRSTSSATTAGDCSICSLLTTLMLNGTKVGTAMRALADNRENTALLGVPVRRVESVAWFGSGIVFGVSGLLLASLVGMEIAALTFTFPVAALAAALIARVESLWITVVAAFVIGLVQSSLGAMNSLAQYRNTTPFVVAIVVLIWFGWRGQTQKRIA